MAEWIVKYAGLVSLGLVLYQFWEARRSKIILYIEAEEEERGISRVLSIKYSLQNRGRATAVFEIGLVFSSDGASEDVIIIDRRVISIPKDGVVTGDGRIEVAARAGKTYQLYAKTSGDRRWNGDFGVVSVP